MTAESNNTLIFLNLQFELTVWMLHFQNLIIFLLLVKKFCFDKAPLIDVNENTSTLIDLLIIHKNKNYK